MECSKLLDIDMRAWHSPSSSACFVLSGAPVTPVLINPQTHCSSNQIWLHISDSKLHWIMTWTNTFWRRCKVQDLIFIWNASFISTKSSVTWQIFESRHHNPSSHIKHIELRRDGKPSTILLLNSSVMNQEEMEPSHFSMLKFASFFSTRISYIMRNQGPHNCISLKISLSPHSCWKSRWHCFQDNVTDESILMWCSARYRSTSN